MSGSGQLVRITAITYHMTTADCGREEEDFIGEGKRQEEEREDEWEETHLEH